MKSFGWKGEKKQQISLINEGSYEYFKNKPNVNKMVYDRFFLSDISTYNCKDYSFSLDITVMNDKTLLKNLTLQQHF